MIPKDYAEAAEVFGATAWQRVRHVTVPLLKASLQVALIIRTILAFQAFAVVIALAAYNMPVLARRTYSWYSDLRNPNVAAAYALLIMLFSLVNTGIYLRALRVRDEEVGGPEMAIGSASPRPSGEPHHRTSAPVSPAEAIGAVARHCPVRGGRSTCWPSC